MPRERKRQGIKLEPMWTSATGDGRNLESPRALYSAVAMFELNNGGRKDTFSEMDDRRELFTTVNDPK